MRDDRERENDPLLFLALFLSFCRIDLRASNSRTPPPPPRGSQKKRPAEKSFLRRKKIYYLGFIIFRVTTKIGEEAKVCFRRCVSFFPLHSQRAVSLVGLTPLPCRHVFFLLLFFFLASLSSLFLAAPLVVVRVFCCATKCR